jgi:hypothetical protein
LRHVVTIVVQRGPQCPPVNVSAKT